MEAGFYGAPKAAVRIAKAPFGAGPGGSRAANRSKTGVASSGELERGQPVGLG